MSNQITKEQVENAVFPILTVIGLVANFVVVAVIVVTGKAKQNKTVANTFVLNLAIADIIFLISLPFYMPLLLQDGWFYGEAMCKILEACKHLSFHTSILLLMAMNFDRYIAIVHSLRSLEYRTQRNARIACAFIWFLCICVSIPILRYSTVEISDANSTHAAKYCIIKFPGYMSVFSSNASDELLKEFEIFGGFGYDYSGNSSEPGYLSEDYGTDYYNSNQSVLTNESIADEFTCYYDYAHLESKSFKAWEYSTFLIFFVFPIAVISFCYGSIMYTAYKRKVVSEGAKGIQARITKMVAVLISAFIICWMPYQVWKLLTVSRGVKVQKAYQCGVIDTVVALLAWSNSVLNPILYSLMSENFRKRGLMTLACLRYGYHSTIRQMSITRGASTRATLRNEETKMTLFHSQKPGTPSPGSLRKKSNRHDSEESLTHKGK